MIIGMNPVTKQRVIDTDVHSRRFFCNGMKRRGFTIVEVIIVITIMGILLVLGVVNLRSSQVSARDAERKTDIETISNHLETYYKYGSDTNTTVRQYPSTVFASSGATYMQQAIGNIDASVFIAPGKTDPILTFIPAPDNTVYTTVSPHPTIDEYVYQPLQADGTLCTSELQECRKFNLYYRLEIDNSVNVLMSKNQ